ncbi:DUF72 domain-containing protein [Carnobacterium maltaromaticum]|uniref:DUF72 domain-containing protein n=1 Tax=Carnobacterium maltaromaticum TaxID=2751 RepID=UPI0039AEFC16
MITIGLTNWKGHESLLVDKNKELENYAAHFPFVEMDTSFYSIQPEANIVNWMGKTPDGFQFIPKAFQAMTTHREWGDYFPSEKAMFQAFIASFSPMLEANRIKAFLFQFPPYFACTKENVDYLRKIRYWMGDLPVAIEFRNNTWFSENHYGATLKFLTELQFIQTTVDQPQTQTNSIPMVLEVTNPSLTLLRLHGRNFTGWLESNSPDWRKKRTLYNYSPTEIKELKGYVETLALNAKEVAVIFNNNSGGHAAPNAKALQKELDLSFENLAPQQLGLDLF